MRANPKTKGGAGIIAKAMEGLKNPEISIGDIHLTDKIAGKLKFEIIGEETAVLYVKLLVEGKHIIKKTASNKKKIFLVLDTSGSMEGEPIEEVKKYAAPLGIEYFKLIEPLQAKENVNP